MTLKINLQKSVAEMLVLSILNNGTMYGYQLIQELEAHYNITEDGKEYLQQILKSYQDMVQGVANVLVKNGQSIHIVTE